MKNIFPNPRCGKVVDVNSLPQPFYDIFLSIPEKESTIEDLMKFTYASQIIQSKKKCKCGASFELYRSTEVKPNEYFNMNIQRAKITTRNLKNTKIIIDNLYKNNYFYEPYAINFHIGSTMDYGHYYR